MSIGVFALVIYDDKIILGKRNYGNFKWTLPGGKVEFGESLMEALKREVFEETGQRIDSFEYVLTAYDRKKYSIAFIYRTVVEQIDSFEYDKNELQDVSLFEINNLPEISDRQKEWINISYKKNEKVKVLER